MLGRRAVPAKRFEGSATGAAAHLRHIVVVIICHGRQAGGDGGSCIVALVLEEGYPLAHLRILLQLLCRADTQSSGALPRTVAEATDTNNDTEIWQALGAGTGRKLG